jgi:hypothetical protein
MQANRISGIVRLGRSGAAVKTIAIVEIAKAGIRIRTSLVMTQLMAAIPASRLLQA